MNWPEATILSVEPQEDKVRQARMNLVSRQNVQRIHAAVATEDGLVTISNPEAAAWAYRTEAAVGACGAIPALSVRVRSVMARAPPSAQPESSSRCGCSATPPFTNVFTYQDKVAAKRCNGKVRDPLSVLGEEVALEAFNVDLGDERPVDATGCYVQCSKEPPSTRGARPVCPWRGAT